MQGRIDALPAHRPFDLILMCDVLEHIDDDDAALIGARRALRPGGHLLITVPAHPSLWSDFDVASHHFRRYDEPTLRSTIERAGLEVRYVGPFMSLLYPVARLRRRPDSAGVNEVEVIRRELARPEGTQRRALPRPQAGGPDRASRATTADGHVAAGAGKDATVTTRLAEGVTVVVPVYNSEESLGPLSDRLHQVLTELRAPYEIVFVDDGARTAVGIGSWPSAPRTRHVRALRLMRNSGQHNALLAGVRAARYRTTVTIDDDLQHPPEEIPKLLAALDAGAGLAYGVPNRPSHASWRNMTPESPSSPWLWRPAAGSRGR